MLQTNLLTDEWTEVNCELDGRSRGIFACLVHIKELRDEPDAFYGIENIFFNINGCHYENILNIKNPLP